MQVIALFLSFSGLGAWLETCVSNSDLEEFRQRKALWGEDESSHVRVACALRAALRQTLDG